MNRQKIAGFLGDIYLLDMGPILGLIHILFIELAPDKIFKPMRVISARLINESRGVQYVAKNGKIRQ
jgi:hypothetical protein